MGIVTAVCSGKGGVGKSTISLGVARALAQKGRRVLMIDCDAGLRTLDKITGTDKDLVYDISDIIKGNCPPIDAIYDIEGENNLFLIPAPSDINNMVSLVAMQKIVALLKKYYDHIILDCPAGIGSGFKSALSCADRALVICNADPVSVKSGAIIQNILSQNKNIDLRLIINRFDKQIFIQMDVLEDLDTVIDETGIRLIGIVPEDNSMASALFKGIAPNEKYRAVLAFKRIAARIEGVNGPIVL